MHWERLDEPVKVRVDFSEGVATPIRFRLGGRAYRVMNVNSRWEAREGRKLRHFFAVTTDSQDAYQLSFDPEGLVWRVDGVMYDG